MIRSIVLIAVAMGCALVGACYGNVDGASGPGQSNEVSPPPSVGFSQPQQDVNAYCIHGAFSIRSAPAAEWSTGECAAKLKPTVGDSECRIDGQDLPSESELEIVQTDAGYTAKIYLSETAGLNTPEAIPQDVRDPWIQVAMKPFKAEDDTVKWLKGSTQWPKTDEAYLVYVFLDGFDQKHYRVEFFSQRLCSMHTPDTKGQIEPGTCPAPIKDVKIMQWPTGGGDPGTKGPNGQCVWP
jgi:hypothetical protein